MRYCRQYKSDVHMMILAVCKCVNWSKINTPKICTVTVPGWNDARTFAKRSYLCVRGSIYHEFTLFCARAHVRIEHSIVRITRIKDAQMRRFSRKQAHLRVSFTRVCTV